MDARLRWAGVHNYVLFSSAYSLVRGFLCCKQTCTVTVCDKPLDEPPSVDSTSFIIITSVNIRRMLCDRSLSFFHSFCHSVNRITDERGN